MNHLHPSGIESTPAFRGSAFASAKSGAAANANPVGTRFHTPLPRTRKPFDSDDTPQRRKQPYRRDRKKAWLDDVFE